MTRNVEFGKCDDSDDEEEETKNIVSQKFDINRLLATSKLSGLSKHLHIYSKKNLPLSFQLNVGILGKLAIYIKEKEEI